MAYTTIDDPEAYFQAKKYTGNGSADTAITFDGDTDLEPDLLWIKRRDTTFSHLLFDSVRGITKRLIPNSTAVESTESQIASFDSDGWTMDADTANNADGGTYAAWCWKESAVSGMDIVTYTGNATARTISHSLSAVPHVIICKPRESGSEGFAMYHKGIASDPETDFIRLDEASYAGDNANYWNDTAPTSSVFTVGSDSAVNHNTGGIVAYVFSEKQGFSKFGSWVGNGDADGPFLYTGFKPSWILYKRSTDSTEGWVLQDNKISPFNVSHVYLSPHSTAAESDTSNANLDFLSNGFKLRHNDTRGNTTGTTYIYMAFAEAPFVNSNGVPTTAR